MQQNRQLTEYLYDLHDSMAFSFDSVQDEY